jgi:hypothetical protein
MVVDKEIVFKHSKPKTSKFHARGLSTCTTSCYSSTQLKCVPRFHPAHAFELLLYFSFGWSTNTYSSQAFTALGSGFGLLVAGFQYVSSQVFIFASSSPDTIFFVLMNWYAVW